MTDKGKFVESFYGRDIYLQLLLIFATDKAYRCCLRLDRGQTMHHRWLSSDPVAPKFHCDDPVVCLVTSGAGAGKRLRAGGTYGGHILLDSLRSLDSMRNSAPLLNYKAL